MRPNRIEEMQRKGKHAFLLPTLLLLALALGLGLFAVAGLLSRAGAIALCAILLLGILVSAAAYGIKRRRMRLMQLALRDTARAGNMKLALGEDGVRQLLPYFRKQMGEGSTAARLLILDLVRGIEFDGKDALIKAAYDFGPLEVRLAVIDQIFDWNLPFELLPDVMEQDCAETAEYLVRKIFVHISDIEDHDLLDRVCARADHLRDFVQSEEIRRMAAYVFYGRREEYEIILRNLLQSDRKEDRLFATRLMAVYIGREDTVNRRYLAQILPTTVLNPSEAEETIELCAEYDADKAYLKQYLSGYYSDTFLNKVVEYYEPAGIVRSFGESVCPVPMALTLLAACRLERGSLSAYRAMRDRLSEYLVLLEREETKILAAQSGAGRILLDEIAVLRRSLSAALAEFSRADETGTNALAFSAACSREDQAWKLKNEPEGYDYRVLKISESNTLLESIYRYVGGESMETKLTENIEKLIALKTIPMFSELDVFTLQQIQKIATYQKIPAHETVITEGEEGESLFVVISGSVGVSKAGACINEIGAGGFFGEMAIIEKQKRSATITTLEETDFLIIRGDDFATLLSRNSSISGSVIRMLSGRLRKMLEER